MGKKSKIIMGLATAAMIPAILTGCGHKEHDPKDEWKTDATHHWHECEEKKCDEKIDKAEHEATGTWVTTDTHHYKDCDDCGYDIGYAAHAYDQEVVASGYLKTEATASTKAVYYKSCICGKAGTDTFESGLKIGTISNLAISSKTYDGTAVSAPTYDKNTDGTVTVEYKLKTAADTTYTTTAPINAGEYTARVSIAESGNYTSVSATKDFIISKATATITNVAMSQVEIVYKDNYSVNYSTNSNGAVTFEYKLRNADDNTYTTTAPIDAGEYTARVKVAESDNYTAITSTPIDFEIEKYKLENLHTTVTYNGTLYHFVNLDQIAEGLRLDVTFNSENVGATPTAVQLTLNSEETQNYEIITSGPNACTVEIVAKEVSLEWTAPNLDFSGTEKTPTVIATDLCGEDTCDVTIIRANGDNFTYGESFTFEATGLSNDNYKLPTNITSPTYTINDIESMTVDTAEDVGYVEYGTPQFLKITLDEGYYSFNFQSQSHGTFAFELYYTDTNELIADVTFEDGATTDSKVFNITESGEYYIKWSLPNNDTVQNDTLTIVSDTHAEINEQGLCVICGEHQGDTIEAGETITLSLEKDEKAYYRVAYTYDKYYSRTFTSPLQSGDIKFDRVDNEGIYHEIPLTNSAIDFEAPFDNYIYIVITAGATFENGTFTINEHDSL